MKINLFCLLLALCTFYKIQAQPTGYLHRTQVPNAEFHNITNEIEKYYSQFPNLNPYEGDAENDYKRWKWFWETRLDLHDGTNGKFEAGTRAMEDYLINRSTYCSSTGEYQGQWELLGPDYIPGDPSSGLVASGFFFCTN